MNKTLTTILLIAIISSMSYAQDVTAAKLDAVSLDEKIINASQVSVDYYTGRDTVRAVDNTYVVLHEVWMNREILTIYNASASLKPGELKMVDSTGKVVPKLYRPYLPKNRSALINLIASNISNTKISNLKGTNDQLQINFIISPQTGRVKEVIFVLFSRKGLASGIHSISPRELESIEKQVKNEFSYSIQEYCKEYSFVSAGFTCTFLDNLNITQY